MYRIFHTEHHWSRSNSACNIPFSQTHFIVTRHIFEGFQPMHFSLARHGSFASGGLLAVANSRDRTAQAEAVVARRLVDDETAAFEHDWTPAVGAFDQRVIMVLGGQGGITSPSGRKLMNVSVKLGEYPKVVSSWTPAKQRSYLKSRSLAWVPGFHAALGGRYDNLDAVLATLRGCSWIDTVPVPESLARPEEGDVDRIAATGVSNPGVTRTVCTHTHARTSRPAPFRLPLAA
jgi:hypothetical protein